MKLNNLRSYINKILILVLPFFTLNIGFILIVFLDVIESLALALDDNEISGPTHPPPTHNSMIPNSKV